jgi:hypothetical protein
MRMVDYPNRFRETILCGYYKSESPSLTWSQIVCIRKCWKIMKGETKYKQFQSESQRIF